MKYISIVPADFKIFPGILDFNCFAFTWRICKNQNSVFLEPQSMEPYNDQWEFLEDIEKISYQRFKEIYESLFDERPHDKILASFNTNEPVELELINFKQSFPL